MSANHLVISHLQLRRLIGLIGLLHPPILFLGGYFIFGLSLQSSMSSYYYTEMRDVFVGLGFVTGAFFICYKGHDWRDVLCARLAGAAAIISAIFPTHPEGEFSHLQDMANSLHTGSALLFLFCAAYYSLILFPKGNADTPIKRWRKKVYQTSGIIISLGIVSFLVIGLSPSLSEQLKPYRPTFMLEAICFWSFGVAWLVKGQALKGESRARDGNLAASSS